MTSKNKYSLSELKKECVGEPFTLQQIQARLLEMMISFDAFCKTNGIPYFLTGGTLLGAIRHKGFIPWDDDVDIFIPRDEYERFITLGPIDGKYEIVSYKNDRGYYHPYPYCNIADPDTVMLEYNSKYPTGKGLFLDIWPLDGMPGKKDRKAFIRKLMFYRYAKGLPQNPIRKIHSLKDLGINFFSTILSCFNEMELVKKIDDLVSSYDYKTSNDCGCPLVAAPEKVIWPRWYYDKSVECEFEGHMFSCPAEYDLALRDQYGDYMELPKKEEQIAHHGYDVYKRKSID